MIGGKDLIFPIRDRKAAVTKLLAIIAATWPKGVMQSDDGLQQTLIDTLSAGQGQFFVYQDGEALMNWALEGLSEKTCSTMIQVILGQDEITIVVDDGDDLWIACLAELRTNK